MGSGWSAELSTDVDKLEVIWVSTEDELVVGGAVVSLDADSEWLYVAFLEPGIWYTVNMHDHKRKTHILLDCDKSF